MREALSSTLGDFLARLVWLIVFLELRTESMASVLSYMPGHYLFIYYLFLCFIWRQGLAELPWLNSVLCPLTSAS